MMDFDKFSIPCLKYWALKLLLSPTRFIGPNQYVIVQIGSVQVWLKKYINPTQSKPNDFLKPIL